jgi:hypothetical protein
MPSRRVIALIALFWLAITSYVTYRDLWPVLFASGQPSIAIDLADEAAQNIPIRWSITYNGQKAGRLISQMRYIDADDTFRFTHDYKQLRYEIAGATIALPELQIVVRVTRAGDLREQSLRGKMELGVGNLTLGEGTANVTGIVTDGQLTATCVVTGTAFGKAFEINRKLDPVPVPSGQPLNPLLPMNRLAGVKPGRQWVVHASDPLADAAHSLAKEYGLPLPEEKPSPLIGEVQSESQELRRTNDTSACWVIEYRREGELEARTWVRVTDGKVLKQEAFLKGDTLALERED